MGLVGIRPCVAKCELELWKLGIHDRPEWREIAVRHERRERKCVHTFDVEAKMVRSTLSPMLPGAYLHRTVQSSSRIATARTRASPTPRPRTHIGHLQYDLVILAGWTDQAATDANINWTRELFDALQPHLDHGVYVNDLGEEGGQRVRDAYGVNYARLAAVKAQYDRTNFFRLNQNIPPAR